MDGRRDAVTDDDRRALGVPTLAESEVVLRQINGEGGD